MSNKIVLISDDKDFFEFIRTKIALRKSDELFSFKFDDIPNKIHLLTSSVLIVNAENSHEKTLDLLNIFKGLPIIVMAFNEDEVFKQKCYKSGMLDFITLLTSEKEFQSRLIPALTLANLLKKNEQYREILVKNEILSKINEVFLDYGNILENNLEKINSEKRKAVFMAISPNDKTKFILQPAIVESVITSNIRKNDILMNYAPNKYFLLLLDIDLSGAKSVWQKIINQIPQKIYAGFSKVSNQRKQQLINEALNKLHEAINSDKNIVDVQETNPVSSFSTINGSISPINNFKMFRQEFEKKIEQVITPVFYQIQQKYSDELSGVTLQQGYGDGYGTFYIKGKAYSSCFRITSPGFSKINIDITCQKDSGSVDAKRISLEPEELEAGLLSDLLEQFVNEYKEGC